jgi:PTH1 family peptidyl-tRNA hydrolase
MRIIVGLGNPGEKYTNTRHNAGFMAVDMLARQKNLNWKMNKKFKAEIAEDSEMILVKPQTFMNESGQSVAAILRYYHLLPRSIFGAKKNADLRSTLLVIHDELDLPFGGYKTSVNSSSAGHNGVQSIIDSLKTQYFKRLRIGVSTEARKQIPSDKFVLQRFSKEEETELPKIIAKIISEI